MMIELYLIRHAESENNLHYSHIIGGRSNNTPLTRKGRMQSELLGQYLRVKGIKFDAIYSSIAIRAKDTARIASNEQGINLDQIIMTDKLLELSQGDWQGLIRSEKYTPELVSLIEKNSLDFRPPNGESQREVEERMMDFISNNILSNYTDATIAAYSHGMAIKCLLRGVMDFQPYLTRHLTIDNTAVTRMTYQNKKWYVHMINDTTHLFSYLFSQANEKLYK